MANSEDHMRRRVIGLLVVAALVAVTSAAAARAQQSLVGSTLRPVDDAEALIGGLIEMFAGGSGAAKASFDRVVVTEDSAGRLAVTVAHKGLANLTLSGEVRGRDRRRQANIQVQPAAIADAAGETPLVFELHGAPDEGLIVESAYLRLVAIDPARGSTAVASRLYTLQKHWSASPAPSRVTITVAPTPIGATASLGSRPDYAPPPKVLVPMRFIQRDAQVGRADAVAISPRAAEVARQPQTTATAPAAGRIATMSPAVLAQRKATAEKTKPATSTLPEAKRTTTLVHMDRFQFGVRPDDAQKGAQGPSGTPIELLEGLRTEDIGLNPALLLSMATSVYPDKNRASGVFYYHPRAYHLEWTPESGHGMRILYGAAAADGAAGDVLMAARLQSGLDASEVQLANELLSAYRRRNPSTVFSALRPLPLEKDGVDVSLGAVLGQYSIPKDKIAITGLSDVLGEIEVSWVTDPVTKENLQLALMRDVGVSGDVGFAVSGGALAPQVPIAIQIADRDSFGRMRWNRTDGHRNLTPYPIRLRYLHALVIDPRNNVPFLYTWSLDNTEVPPQAMVRWDPARVPAWIDSEAKRIWIDYAVVDTCDQCDRQVIDNITGGVTSIAAEQITFHTITPLADVGGYEITAQVRSKFFDPKDRAVLQKSIVLAADGQDFVLRPVYNVSRPAGEPLFEYLLELAMPDGTIHKGTRWIPGDGLRILVGRAQLEQSLGTLPGKVNR